MNNFTVFSHIFLKEKTIMPTHAQTALLTFGVINAILG
jgi:hypothetical protein